MVRRVVIGLGMFGAVVAACLLANVAARAQPAFKKLFDEKYMKEDTKLFKAYASKTNCNVCHCAQPEMLRGIRSSGMPYGKALAKRLNRDDAKALTAPQRTKDPIAAQKAEDKVKAAFEAVEKERSDPKDPKSPTFGELIKTGKLPMLPITPREELKDE